ncbi:unnamed protein product [Microthlaspi erraticum]|uniref:Agenet domain-containing protein n=1 Tax=Microthlaspi erraticum TaxID=1685480 RepID=A0A6D2IN46_9BRAS|nr:unnamed protein product [Microthlaspi erraticum]
MQSSSSIITGICKLEVSCKKDGFKGAWYSAIQREHSHGNLFRVTYTTLRKEDGLTPLTEFVDQSLVRPVPPKDLNDKGSVFQEGSVVDAYAKGGWWTGLVLKRKEEGYTDTDTYLVLMDSPPDVIQFERKKLRAHLDWTDGRWVRPENKGLIKSAFSPGTMVEVEEPDTDWRPAMIIKEVENGKSFIVKYFDHKSCSFREGSGNVIVDSREVKPRQPLVSVADYDVLDQVEALAGLKWRQRVVRGVIYKGLRYMVSSKDSKVASQFSVSDLRPPMEWKDGIWQNRSPKPKETRSKSGIFGKCYTRKRRRGGGEEHNPDLSDTVLSSDRTLTVVNNSTANVEDTRKVLPFAKKSPIWKAYEAMDVFKTLPQNPHFSPLSETKEDFREGSALGMMATFSGLLENFKDLETDVTKSQLDTMKDSFTELEQHGFDVERPLLRIEKLLAFKDRQVSILKEREGFEKEMMVESSKKRKAEQEFSDIERKMLEVKQEILKLQWQEAALREEKEVAKEEKDAAYKNICERESCGRELSAELEDVEFDFETILSAPW